MAPLINAESVTHSTALYVPTIKETKRIKYHSETVHEREREREREIRFV